MVGNGRAVLRSCRETLLHPLHELTTHRARTALVVVTLLLTASDWLVRPASDSYSIVISLIHTASIALICLFPRIGAGGVLAVEIVCCFANTGGGASRLWGMCLAAGVIVYIEGTLFMASACFLVNLLIQLSQTRLDAAASSSATPTVPTSVFLLSCIGISEIIGYGLRRRDDLARRTSADYRQSLRRQEDAHASNLLEYASQLHDSVAGSLANIVLTAQQHIDGPSTDSDDSVAWNHVDREAQQALAQIHRIIDAMSMRQQNEKVHTDLPGDLRALCRTSDQSLQARGLHGSSMVHDFGITVQPDGERVRMLQSLIRELYVNMAKYAADNTPYQMSVTVCDDFVEIIQTNAVVSGLPLSQGNKGLVIHAQQINRAGGDLSYAIRDAQWTCFAHLPLV